MEWRTLGKGGSVHSECERAAADLVEEYGTHYNERAEYGGKVYQSYFYNEDQMSSTQKSSMEETSTSSMGVLFFEVAAETTNKQQDMSSMKKSKSVMESRLNIFGGDPSAGTATAWCNTVSKAPAIIGNSIIVPIADLIEEGSFARAAALFAGLDKWVCNGRGNYVNIDKNKGYKGECKCQDDDSFYLDEFCAPQSPKCYDGSRLVDCHFEKILVAYTMNYSYLWDDQGSGGEHDVSLFKPAVAQNKALVGTVAFKGYSKRVDPIVTIDVDTSPVVAREATEFYKVWADYGTGADADGSVYRAKCPPGYNSISDFGQHL
ncbi:hypothetical protein BSKO_06626 [Bryopsis sp. KO-2023]|nr:hypothetical protein BSKO_06626 [Bryopsis sp. KO-2023]